MSDQEMDNEDMFADADEDALPITATGSSLAQAEDKSAHAELIAEDWPALPTASAPQKPLQWAVQLSRAHHAQQKQVAQVEDKTTHVEPVEGQEQALSEEEFGESDDEGSSAMQNLSLQDNPLADASSSIDALVLDSAAFIRGAPVERWAKTFYTVPEVVAEIRDEAARERLAHLPFHLNIKEPSQEAFDRVSSFARKTGDFSSLSGPDMRVLALTYMLEVERNGSDHLASAPKLLAPPKAPVQAKPQPQSQQPKQLQQSTLPVDEEQEWSTVPLKTVPQPIKPKQRKPKAPTVSASTPAAKETPTIQPQTSSTEQTAAEANSTDAGQQLPGWNKWNADDNDGWITSDNAAQVTQHHHKQQGLAPLTATARVSVGCVTTDYAMQNVLMQLGLHVVSLDGMLIQQVKTFVRKCSACLTITHKTGADFCPSCGHYALYKIQMKIDKNGQVRYMEPRNKRFNLRGTIYSLPAPSTGRAPNIILRPDQKEYKMRQKANNSQNSRAPTRTLPAFGYGRKNPNEPRKKV